MTTYGFTPQGFVAKTQAVIIGEINAALQAVLGAQVNLLPATVLDALRGTFSDRETALWQLGQALGNILDADAASDVFLDNILALTGTARLGATKSTVSEVLIGTNATVVPAGTQLATTGTATPFTTNANAAIATLAAWGATHLTAVGDLVQNDTGKVYSCVGITGDALTAGAGGPTGTGTAIVDNHVTWRYCGAGTAAVAAACTASSYGALVAPAGTLTTITTPVAGLATVVNPLDAIPGRANETDAAARIRRVSLLHASGNAAFDAIRAALLAVTGVTAVSLLANDGDVVDVNGLLPHSIEPIISGTATTAAILAAIHASKAAGIQTSTTGTSNGVATDSQGGSHTYYFTRPAALNIYIAITATLDSAVFDATNGPTRIKANLAAFALGTLLGANGKPLSGGYKAGDQVIDSALYPAIFLEPGVKDVSALYIGTAPGPGSSANIAVGLRQVAAFDTARITFNGA